jgi:hypothetical protein
MHGNLGEELMKEAEQARVARRQGLRNKGRSCARLKRCIVALGLDHSPFEALRACASSDCESVVQKIRLGLSSSDDMASSRKDS